MDVLPCFYIHSNSLYLPLFHLLFALSLAYILVFLDFLCNSIHVLELVILFYQALYPRYFWL